MYEINLWSHNILGVVPPIRDQSLQYIGTVEKLHQIIKVSDLQPGFDLGSVTRDRNTIY